MTSLNNLPTMDFHFFKAPNRVLITKNDYSLIVTAEINENFEEDFILDTQSFDLIKKLDEREIKVKENQIIIKAKQGTFKCQLIEKQLPELYLNEIVYENEYNTAYLKEAVAFTSHQQAQIALNGLLLNDCGSIYATDIFKFYYRDAKESENYFSVPVEFINFLPSQDKTTKLAFTRSKVIYKGDYKMFGRLYDGKVPKLYNLISNFESLGCVHFKNLPEFNLLDSTFLILKNNDTNDGLKFIFDNVEKQFVIEQKGDILKNISNNQIKMAPMFFKQVLSICEEDIEFEYTKGRSKINNHIILCHLQD